MNTVGKRTKHIRKELNITQKDLSSITGMSQGSISSIEQDKINYSFEAIISLCQYFNKKNISIDWLLTGNGEMHKSSPVNGTPSSTPSMGDALNAIGNTPVHKTLSKLGAGVSTIGKTPVHEVLSDLGVDAATIGDTPVHKTLSNLGLGASSIGKTPFREKYDQLGKMVSELSGSEENEAPATDNLINVEGFSELRKDEKILIKCYRGMVDEAQDELTDYALELYQKKGKPRNDKSADLSNSDANPATDTGLDFADDITYMAN